MLPLFGGRCSCGDLQALRPTNFATRFREHRHINQRGMTRDAKDAEPMAGFSRNEFDVEWPKTCRQLLTCSPEFMPLVS